MSISRKRIFHLAAPPPTTIYVRPGYNRVLAEDHGTPDALSIG
jgi:transcription elongation factor GreA